MVNESHALDAHEFHAPRPLFGARGRPDEENQKSSLSLTFVTHTKADF
jgi:hypothetical protein